MAGDDSVIGWVRGLEFRNPDAAQRLWERYFAELARLAGGKLPRHARRSFDEVVADQHRRVARLKFDRHTAAEIADRLDQCPRSVERLLQQIRRAWEPPAGA